ncbi:hypothetical protein DUI87_03177 [Hirundo rustica rustica]|uniref:RNA-directed DNA polymerase n=1 Tax=Hirundo rustica rustica TaxID=333673 RepID=A0A3M0LKK4_HIRRU|nr:hypothetical protein DUI87_03177 [Hirundo rustica rustica]
MFEHLLQSNASLQLSLDSYRGQISVHAPSHKLLNEEFHLIPREKRSRRPLKALTVFTDASGASHKSVMTWRNPQTQHWEADVEFVEGSPQVAELAAVAKLSHQQYHQNVPGLIRQFQLTRSQARAIVATCPNCQVQAMPSMEKAYLTLNPVMNPIQVVILLLLNSLATAWIIPQPCQNVWVTLAQTLQQENICLSTASTENPMSTCLILLEDGFAIKKSKVKRPACEIQFLGVKWQDGRPQIPTDVINKITAMSPPTNKKETQAFLGAIGFWRMHILECSQIVSPLYLVTHKKNNFHWGPEQQQAFAQIKQEIAHAVTLGPVRTGPDVKNVLYSAAGSHGLSWSLWQKVPGETRGRPLGFWSRSYRGSETNHTPTEKEILAAYEGVQAASEVIGMNRKWKAAVWSPTRQVAEATEGEGGSSQLAELKAVQLALDIAEREGWPRLYLYTDSWMVANALWGWLKRWKEANWQHGGKPIWAAEEWKDIATRVIHDCQTCAAIKQAKRVKPLWYGGRWSKYKYGEAWQIDYITLPQTRQGKRYVLTMVEATTGWLETYPVPHATARNTILGLEKQVLWRHGTPERIESDNRTHFKNSLINTWAREHGIEWVYHIPYHAPTAGKVERHNALLKTQLKALGGGSFKNWEQHLAKATWLVNTQGSTN